jgi:HEAT repeat protein
MKNVIKSRQSVTFGLHQNRLFSLVWMNHSVTFVIFALAMLIVPTMKGNAQNLYGPNRVSSVSVEPSAAGVVVSIAAEAPVVRAQTWQDSEGYHLVLPNTAADSSLRAIRGVKFRRIGSSLEVLLQTKAGSKVIAQAANNQINLVVDRKLDSRPAESEFPTSKPTEPQSAEIIAQNQTAHDGTQLKLSTATSELPTASSPSSITTVPADPPANTKSAAAIVPQADASTPAEAAAPQVTVQQEPESVMASIFSATSVFIVIVLGLFGLLVSKKLRSRQALERQDKIITADDEWVDDQTSEGEIRAQNETPSTTLARTNSAAAASTRSAGIRPVSGPTSLFGAYRIDQEVGKLVLGQPHRMDVVASRAIDDRRAIEASLIKGVNSLDLDESARKRARAALEEYGFVARQCATLLMSADAFERTSAARSLGEIQSEAALPFLLESLYDSESIVRNQAVVSIGELKLPSAIGALLDIARTHPDVPSNLLSKTLSACSVEGLDFFDAITPEPAQLGTGSYLSVVDQITHLEPAASVEELPEDLDDEQLKNALSLCESADVQERAEGLKTLGQFRIRSAVEAIARVGREDSEANLRAMAISSLGSIDHESVFPAILVGMADESREVRAAAARTLNRLSFDRADAYVRVVETSDPKTLADVARACVQAGIVSQNVDRLAVSDYRQAYETFSLICLLAKADFSQPILDVIAEHQNSDVRLKAVHLLAATGQPGVFEELRQLAVREGVSEEVKTALLEAMYKLDQEAKQDEPKSVEATIAAEEPEFKTFPTREVGVESEQSFAFAFGAASESEVMTDLSPDVHQEMDELEM